MLELRSFLFNIAVLVVASTLVLAQDYACSKDTPCKNGGCCRINSDGKGNCGLGPTFCGAGNCTDFGDASKNCGAKAECNPGWDPKYSLRDACPLNVCCGQYGYCGTTPEFCGNSTVQRPTCSTNTTSVRTIGYAEGWGAIAADQIPLGIYTHINVAFLFIDPKTFEVTGMDNKTSAQYSRMASLKARQPGLQTWISVGGYSFNDPGPYNSTFSDLANSTTAQDAFFKSLISFMRAYKIDGIDIDWEYPVSAERNGRTEDFKNFVTLMWRMRAAFDASGSSTRLGTSITLPAGYYYLKGFDIANLQNYVDFFNLMTYDYHGTWDKPALAYAHTNLTEIEATLDLMWRNSIDPQKINLGLGFYGRSFTLATNVTCNSLVGCPFVSGGVAGPQTNSSGILGATEIKNLLIDPSKNVSVTYDPVAAVKIATWDKNQWIAYDDSQSFSAKLHWANSKCLGGSMVWSVDMDDGSLAEALAAAGHMPVQYVVNGTKVKTSSPLYSNASVTAAPYANATTLQSSAAGTRSVSVAVPVTSAASNATSTSSVSSNSIAPTATAAPTTSGTATSSGSAPSPVGDGTSSDCKAWYLVQKGDGCANMATAMKIELKDFYSWNPAVKTDCSGLMSGFYVCVGTGSASATTITTALVVPSAASSSS